MRKDDRKFRHGEKIILILSKKEGEVIESIREDGVWKYWVKFDESSSWHRETDIKHAS